MPNFKKNTGYAMRGSEFYGHGSSSPAKVSDSDLLGLQSKLNKSELDYKEPGWAKVARSVHESAMAPIKGAMSAIGGAKGEDPEVNAEGKPDKDGAVEAANKTEVDTSLDGDDGLD